MGRCSGLGKRRFAHDPHFCLRSQIKQLGRALLGVPQYPLIPGHEARARIRLCRWLQAGIERFKALLDASLGIAQIPQQFVHLALDPGDLLQPQSVHLCWSHRACRVALEEDGVWRCAVWQVLNARVIRCYRELARQQGPHALQGRDDGFTDLLFGLLPGFFPLGLRQARDLRRALHERAHEHILRRWRRQKPVQSVEGRLENEFRRYDSVLRARLCFRHPLTQHAWQLPQSREIAVDVARVSHRVNLAHEVDQADVQAAELIKHVAPVLKLRNSQRVAQLPFERCGGGALDRVHLRARIFSELRERAANPLHVFSPRGLAQRNAIGEILGRELPIQSRLLGASEILLGRRTDGVGAHPLCRKRFGKLVEGFAFLCRRHRRGGMLRLSGTLWLSLRERKPHVTAGSNQERENGRTAACQLEPHISPRWNRILRLSSVPDLSCRPEPAAIRAALTLKHL